MPITINTPPKSNIIFPGAGIELRENGAFRLWIAIVQIGEQGAANNATLCLVMAQDEITAFINAKKFCRRVLVMRPLSELMLDLQKVTSGQT